MREIFRTIFPEILFTFGDNKTRQERTFVTQREGTDERGTMGIKLSDEGSALFLEKGYDLKNWITGELKHVNVLEEVKHATD